MTVVPLICMRRAELPLIGRTVAGIPMLREAQLEHRIATAAPVLDALTVARLGDLVERTMPVQTRHRMTVRAGDTADTTDTAAVMTGTLGLGDRVPEPAGASSTLGLAANLAVPQP